MKVNAKLFFCISDVMYIYVLLITEHVVSIIANMLRNCRGTQRQRLMTKFVENDMEKVDRLMELHFKYMEKIEIIDAAIDTQVNCV